jgi:endonuclease YncB( thermonuclease family)
MPVGGVVRLHNVRNGKWAGRVVARVTVDGKDVAAILISEGLGREYHGGKRRGWCD